VEAVVGLALVSLLTAGTAGLLVTSSRAVRMARLSTSATLLASQKVEQLRTDDGAAAGTYEDRVSADGAPAGTTNGAFVRRWVPELEALPVPAIFEPWRFGGAKGYPAPIVEHADARQRALAAFKR